jgi:hypothetical protein
MAKAKLTDKGFTVKTKPLKGDTLAELDKERKKNGMVDPNDKSQKFYAATDVTIELKPGADVWYPGSFHIINHKVLSNPQLLSPEVIVSAVITICVPSKLTKFSKEAKAEWKRFYKEVEKHEKEHVRDGKKLAETMLKEVTGLSVKMETETVNEADMRKLAMKLLTAEMVRVYGGGAIADRVNKAMAKLDSVSGHGGVKLKTSIP